MNLLVHSHRRLLSSNLTLVFCRAIHNNAPLPVPPKLNVLETPDDTEKARSWIAKFQDANIPRSHVELQFARSSGPGGQNVNKVNTKVIIKCPLNSSWIPAWARSELLNSPYYISSSHSIQVASTATRSQAQNIDDCLAKLHSAVLLASKALIKIEPSKEQKKKVDRFRQAEKTKQKKEKMHRSDVKRNRSDKDWF